MRKLLLCLLVGCAVSGCVVTDDRMGARYVATAPSRPGLWRLQDITDGIARTETTVATIRAHSAIQQSRRKSFTAVLSLFCEKGLPTVHVSFQGVVSSRETAEFAYRADSNPGQTLSAEASSNRKTLILTNERHIDEFLRQRGSANTLFVRSNAPRLGISQAEFSTYGAAEAIEAALRDCLPSTRAKEQKQKT